MKHYGIWFKETEHWWVDDSGIVFSTTSVKVAEAQLEMGITHGVKDGVCVKEFK